MKKFLTRLMFLTMTAALASCSAAGFRAARIETGATRFQDDDDDTIGDSPEVGVGYSFQDDLPANAVPQGWVGDVALRFTPIDGDQVSGDREALDAGARFYPFTGNDSYQLFIGLGGTLQRFSLDDGSSSATEIIPGVYGVVGVEYVVGRLRLGIQYRHTAGVDAELGSNPEEQELDGGSLTLSMGFNL